MNDIKIFLFISSFFLIYCDSEKINAINIQDNKIISNQQLSGTEMYIPSNYIRCPSGGIAINEEMCKYVQGNFSVTCPKTKPVLCPDFSCVEIGSKCSINIPQCPTHKPYKCWNNECRKSFNECPTKITCDNDNPILCQNGFCVKSVEECQEKKEEVCNYYRCFDGTCASSMELCPTYKYCGKDQIQCWNGACVDKIEECRTSGLPKCLPPFNFRCPDGSCRQSSKECSTISVCPVHLPIKCFDNSCRASISECPEYQSCGENKVSCPDGTCATSHEKCNTIITCLNGNFLCSDNSCRAQLDDCPEPPKCGKDKVLCSNGACLSSRQNCKTFDHCDASNPIKCEMNTCTDVLNQCQEKTKRCPFGYILCGNGECKTSEYLCDDFICPKNKPYLCKEGVCVHDKKLCDIEENGCPYNAPVKCPNGTCVVSEIKCSEFACPEGKKTCPDGSCTKDIECPLMNGCYKDRPFKCADGSCINPKTSSCTVLLCPFNLPYKCPNGNCVEKSSDCSSMLNSYDLGDCGNGLIMCVDGRCVESIDYCKPNFECETGYIKCQDGSCRVSKDLCPSKIQCPPERPMRCPNQVCVKESKECFNGFICPWGYTKCPTTGDCVEKREYCKEAPRKNDGCTIYGKIRCSNGRCGESLLQCSLMSDACPDDEYPYLCNGDCIKDLNSCDEKNINDKCSKEQFLCPSGRCIDNTWNDKRTKCTNYIGCPLDKPYRCSNGKCVQSERKCYSTTLSEYNEYISNIACDVSKPYLCSDYSCVSDPTFCKPYVECATDEIRCDNGFCSKSSEGCSKFINLCPISNPIQCPSGSCVDNILKCSPSFIIPICSEGEFYCARMNKCMKNKLDCLIFYEKFLEKKEEEGKRMLLINEMDNKDMDKKFDNVLLKENNEPEEKEIELKQSVDDGKLDGIICYDGTIATGGERCPVVPSCKIGQYRCENGGCATNKDDCRTNENYICVDGQKKCPDGLCHKSCDEVDFNGCEVGKFQCSNGLCVEDEYDCIGHSMCPDPSTPFRCMSGECKNSINECELVEKIDTVKNIAYTYNKNNKIEFAFAFDDKGRIAAKIELPGNSLQPNEDYSRIFIKEVPLSLLNNPKLYNNSPEFIFNVSNSIVGSEGVLTYENSIMSPVFKFYGEKYPNFKYAGKINIEYNKYESNELNYSDYCFSKLKGFNMETDSISGDDISWECLERQTEDEQKEFTIKEFGVYAVILNPLRNKINYLGDSESKNFFLENIKTILIVVGCIIIIVGVVFYIFVRVSRYRKKYHDNRKKINLMRKQREEYENMTTDIFGQTLGDNINGFVYKANPAFSLNGEIREGKPKTMEEEIEYLRNECNNVNTQNERLQKDIEDLTEEYKELSASIDNENK